MDMRGFGDSTYSPAGDYSVTTMADDIAHLLDHLRWDKVILVAHSMGGRSATCVGGWQWAVSAFSKHKAEAARLVKYLASVEASKFLAVEGSLLPTYQSVYTDADVVKQVPWFKDAANVVIAGQARPISARYGEVSDTIRTTASAILARTKTSAEGVSEIDGKLARVMR